MPRTVVMKFGGTSVGDSSRVRRAAARAARQTEFPAGAAAGTLLIGGLVILIVTLDR